MVKIGGFCAEVAVLVAVFPTLELLIRGSEVSQGPHLGTVAFVSGAIVIIFMLLAIIIEHRWG